MQDFTELESEIKNAYFKKKFAEYLKNKDLIGAFFLQMGLMENVLKLTLTSLVTLGNQAELIFTDYEIVKTSQNISKIEKNTIGTNISILEQYNLNFLGKKEYETLIKNLKDFNTIRIAMVHNMSREVSIKVINGKALLGLNYAQTASEILIKIADYSQKLNQSANDEMQKMVEKKQEELKKRQIKK